MKRKIFSTIILGLLVFLSINKIEAYVLLSLVVYDVSDNIISTNSDTVTIDIEYSEEVKSGSAQINILNTEGNIVKNLYTNSNDVTNPQKKTWDGKDDSGQNVVGGLYTIQVLGVAKEDASNTISDTSKTILVTDPVLVNNVAPVITLKGDAIVNLDVGDPYEDLGATALDDVNGDLTDSIIIKGVDLVDTSIAGTYTIIYDVSDKAGNPALQVVRTIIVKEKDTDPTPEILRENIIIRSGEKIIYSGTISLPNTGKIDIDGHEVDARSVLGVLYLLDNTDINNTFSISNLSYTPSLSSFLLNCITPSGSEPLCYNWNYVVNNIMPDRGIDKVTLTGGESIGFFFGNSLQLKFDSPITTDNSLVVIPQKYNYLDNSWVDLTDVTLGLLIPNSDPASWDPPVVISDFAVNSEGIYSIKIFNAGTYSVGIKNIDLIYGDYYFPTYPVTVTTPDVSHGGGSSISSGKTFSTSNALSFLSLQQKGNGSFGESLYTDWAAIAAGAGNNSSLKSSISDYLQLNPINSSVITDNERRAMALMSLGINPYRGTSIDYIKKVTDSFDGTQIGDNSLYNDDIFGLIILSKAGYSKNDEIIGKTVSYVILKQSSNGSWGSVDMTAAGIEALRNFKNLNEVKDSISKGELYLKNVQKNDGSFENSSSTSWAIQALSLNSLYNNEANKAIEYLADLQQDDGGLDGSNIDNRVWTTSYAIPAALKLSWNDILESFEKPETQSTDTSSNGAVLSESETDLPILEAPVLVLNQSLDLEKKEEDKKVVVVPKINIVKNLSNPTPEISQVNNLGASTGNAMPVEIPVKKVSHLIINKIIGFFSYIGKGFCDLIIFLFNF